MNEREKAIRDFHSHLHDNKNAISKDDCWICNLLKIIDELRKEKPPSLRGPRCQKGHPMVNANVFITSKGHLRCRRCQAATQKAYRLRKRGPVSRLAKTFCKHGHKLDTENTYLSHNGKRHCRTCRSLARARWRQSQSRPVEFAVAQ